MHGASGTDAALWRQRQGRSRSRCARDGAGRRSHNSLPFHRHRHAAVPGRHDRRRQARRHRHHHARRDVERRERGCDHAGAVGQGRRRARAWQHIRGVDMGQVARTVQTILSAGATGHSATTDFDRFGGSFSIQNGMLWNGDLRLDSAFLHMTGPRPSRSRQPDHRLPHRTQGLDRRAPEHPRRRRAVRDQRPVEPCALCAGPGRRGDRAGRQRARQGHGAHDRTFRD